MKQAVFVLMLVASLGLLSGCGIQLGAPKSPEPGPLDALKATNDLANLGKAMDSNNPEDQAKAMEDLAAWGAEFEKTEFEGTESVDLPSGFPGAFVYTGAKITESSDNSDDAQNLSMQVTIKTMDEIAPIKEFYKKVLSENGWKISSQSNSADGANYDAKNTTTGETLSVDISGNQYSKIRTMYLSYYKYPTQ